MEGFTQRQTIELTQSNPVLVRDQPLVKGDVQALVWIVTVKKNGVPVDLTGATASLYCARALSEDGSGGTTYSAATVEGNGTVRAVLPTDAANIPGPVGCMIRVTRDGASVAVARMAVMAVDQTGDDILDEGKRIPSLDEIMASIARCDAAAEKAEGAAASVGDALKQVASAIEAANGAASDARNAAGQATDGASAAKAAATTATEAATKINDMTITATGLAAGAAPTAELTEVDGHYNIVLGLPKGDKGDPGATPQITVQVKTGEPGTAASVKQTGTAEAPVIELTIPRGDTGSLGTLTINGKAPDAAGKVELTAADVGALSGTDATLTQEGKAADAKAAGDELNQLKNDLADAWTSGKTYTVGDYCISNNQLYKCKIQHTAGSAFDATYWDTVSVASITNDINKRLERSSPLYYSSDYGTLALQKMGNGLVLVKYNGNNLPLTTQTKLNIQIPNDYLPIDQYGVFRGVALATDNTTSFGVLEITVNGDVLAILPLPYMYVTMIYPTKNV